MTDEELREKLRDYNARLRAFGKSKSVFTRLNAKHPGGERGELDSLLKEIQAEYARRGDEAQEQA